MSGPSRPYVPVLQRMWWTTRPSYIRYMLREVTCVWIGAYVVTLVVGLYRLGQGPAAWDAYLQALRSMPGVTFQVVALAFALYHTVTWFALAPSTMPVWRADTQVPPAWVHAAHYAVFAAVSGVVLWAGGVLT